MVSVKEINELLGIMKNTKLSRIIVILSFVVLGVLAWQCPEAISNYFTEKVKQETDLRKTEIKAEVEIRKHLPKLSLD
jgi:hypothetical protein